MRALALLLLALAPAPAIARCLPQVRLTGRDGVLLVGLADELVETGIKTWLPGESGDDDWACAELLVKVEHRDGQIVLSSNDAQGQPLMRAVRSPATAVVLVESWLITEGSVALPQPAVWSFAWRGEGAGGDDGSVAVGTSATLARRVGGLLDLEVTGRLGAGAMSVRRSGGFGFMDQGKPAARFNLELLGGVALRQALGDFGVWIGVAGGARGLLGEYKSFIPVLEPMLGLSRVVADGLELELRLSPQITQIDGPQLMGVSQNHFVMRAGLGVRWELW